MISTLISHGAKFSISNAERKVAWEMAPTEAEREALHKFCEQCLDEEDGGGAEPALSASAASPTAAASASHSLKSPAATTHRPSTLLAMRSPAARASVFGAGARLK